MNDEKNYPKTFDRDNDDIEIHKSLKKDYPSLFNDFDNKDYFIFSLSFGFANENRIPLKRKASGGYFRAETLTPSEWALIKTVAICEESEEVLNDPPKIYQIAEEYAHGGLILLHENLQSLQFGSAEKWLEKEVAKKFQTLEEYS